MAYNEIKEVKGRKYYYRVKSVKKSGKTAKERVYLGVNLSKGELIKKEKEADKQLNLFETFLTSEDINFLDHIKKEFSKEPKENFEGLV